MSLLRKAPRVPREGGYHDLSPLKGDLCQLQEEEARWLGGSGSKRNGEDQKSLGIEKTQVQVPALSTSQPVLTVENLRWADTR